MRRYRLVFLFTLLIASFLAYRSYISSGHSSSSPLLISLDTAEVTHMEQIPCQSAPYQLIREGDRWMLMDEGIYQHTRQEKARSLLDAISQLPAWEVIASGPEAWQEYGLSGRAWKVTIRQRQMDDQVLWLSCPAKGSSDTAYARINDEMEVFATAASQVRTVQKLATFFLLERQLSLSTDLSRYGEIIISARDTNWIIKEGSSKEMSPVVQTDSLEKWLRRVSELRLDAPAEPPVAQFWQFQYTGPGNSPQWLQIFQDQENQQYFIASSRYPNLHFPIDSALANPSLGMRFKWFD